MSFAYVIPVPVRNQHSNITLYDRLASQAGRELKIRGLFHSIDFIVFHFGQIRLALFHDHMASGAGAASAACMLQVKAEIHRDIEQRLRTPMSLVR